MRPLVRVAIASHNLRSVAHAIAANRAAGAPDDDIELQVLRGLGDDLGHALARSGSASAPYCPVGDLVSGMAYLVRRLLENTANESFLAAEQARRGHRGPLGARPDSATCPISRPSATSRCSSCAGRRSARG